MRDFIKMKKIQSVKKMDRCMSAGMLAYVLSIGVGAIVGFFSGGIAWLCVGSFLGLGIGFLVEAALRNHPSTCGRR